MAAFRDLLAGKARLEQVVEVSLSSASKKRRRMRLLAANVQTLDRLLEHNRDDFAIATDKKLPQGDRRRAQRRLILRRRRAVRLVEEVRLRMSRLQSALESLRRISERMTAASRPKLGIAALEADQGALRKESAS